MTTTTELDTKLEEIQARRAKRRNDTAALQKEQYVKDLAAVADLEDELDQSLSVAKCPVYKDGLPSLVAIRAPKGDEYKRFVQQVRRTEKDADGRGKATDLLGETCWAYPKPEEKELRAKMLAAIPGLLVSIANEAAKLAEAKADEEGKG